LLELDAAEYLVGRQLAGSKAELGLQWQLEGLIIRVAVTSNVFEVLIVEAIYNLRSAGGWVDHLEVAQRRVLRGTSVRELLPELVADLNACPRLRRLVDAPLSYCVIVDKLRSVGTWRPLHHGSPHDGRMLSHLLCFSALLINDDCFRIVEGLN